MENRNGLAVESRVVIATGTAERDAAVQMVDTVGLRAGTWAPIRATTLNRSPTRFVSVESRRTLLKITVIDEVLSMGGQLGIPDTT